MGCKDPGGARAADNGFMSALTPSFCALVSSKLGSRAGRCPFEGDGVHEGARTAAFPIFLNTQAMAHYYLSIRGTARVSTTG